MMRPTLEAIDMRADLDRRPRMLLAFRGNLTRWISVKIRAPCRTMREARIYANEELAVMTRAQVQLLFEAARSGPAVHASVGVGLRNAVRQLEGEPLEPESLTTG